MQSGTLISRLREEQEYATVAAVKTEPEAIAREPESQLRARDEQLIEAVTLGDRYAFEMLYNHYAPAVFGLALKMLKDQAAAEEAVQEVFWRVWRRAGSFDLRRSFAPWLFSIAHNYCIDELRCRRGKPQLVYDTADRPVLSGIISETEVVETALQSELRQIVGVALQQLPVEQREVLELAYFGGLTQREIATLLDNSLGTVKTRVQLGIRKLRVILQAQLHDNV